VCLFSKCETLSSNPNITKNITCHPSYSGVRDQEDHGLKPTWANNLRAPILKKPSQKRAVGVTQVVGPEFKLYYSKNKQKEFQVFSTESIWLCTI
jgi:hypothetical protein